MSLRAKKAGLILLIVVIAIASVGGFFVYRNYLDGRTKNVIAFLRDPKSHSAWCVYAKQRCEGAVFTIPTDGYVGNLWGDSFKLFHTHQGIDIFSGEPSGITPVYAPYDGFVTRLETWKSSLIIRVPEDPLQPGRQIWLYMTHLAYADGTSLVLDRFPPGSMEIPVKAGDLLGYQGDYSGNPARPVGVHLHFSIVLDDGQGSFLNELEFENTIDPSPYFLLPLNGKTNPDQIPLCNAR